MYPTFISLNRIYCLPFLRLFHNSIQRLFLFLNKIILIGYIQLVEAWNITENVSVSLDAREAKTGHGRKPARSNPFAFSLLLLINSVTEFEVSNLFSEVHSYSVKSRRKVYSKSFRLSLS